MSQSRPIKALLVEDDQLIIGMYGKKFRDSGFDMTIARTGEYGLEIVEEVNPDVILLDVLLPGIDGFTVLKRLKKNPKVSHVPVILLTNLGEGHDLKRGVKEGALGYLIKAHHIPSEVVEKVKMGLRDGIIPLD